MIYKDAVLKFPRDDGIMPTLTVNIDIVSTSCGIAQKTIGSATRYEFKGMHPIGMINER